MWPAVRARECWNFGRQPRLRPYSPTRVAALKRASCCVLRTPRSLRAATSRIWSPHASCSKHCRKLFALDRCSWPMGEGRERPVLRRTKDSNGSIAPSNGRFRESAAKSLFGQNLPLDGAGKNAAVRDLGAPHASTPEKRARHANGGTGPCIRRGAGSTPPHSPIINRSWVKCGVVSVQFREI